MRTIFFILVFVFAVAAGQAQVNFSLSGGINLTGLKNDWDVFQSPKIYPRFGYSFGGSAEVHLVKSFYIKGQMNITSKNYGFDVEDFYGSGTVGYDRYSIVYLNFPIQTGYYYKNMSFFAGPFFDFCLGGTNQHNLEYFNGETDKGTYGIDPTGELKSSEISSGIFPLQGQNYLDAGMIVGIGHHNDNFSLDLSYAYGLINIFPKVDGSQINRNDYSLYTRVLTVRLNIFL